MISNSLKLRKNVGGMSLILTPLFLFIATLLETRGGSDAGILLIEIAKQPQQNEMSFFLTVYGFVLLIFASIALLHLFRKKATTMGYMGVAFLILGTVSFAYIAGTESMLYIAGSNPAIHKDILAVNNQLGQSIVYNIINLTEVVGWVFGTTFIAIALYKIKIIPKFFSILMIVGVVFRLILAGSYEGSLICEAFYFSGFIYLGYTILKMSDKQWGE